MRRRRHKEMARNPFVNARRSPNSSESKERPRKKQLGTCSCCLRKYRIKRLEQKFCSNRCRLLYWAATEIVSELNAGNAAGLQEIFNRPKDGKSEPLIQLTHSHSEALKYNKGAV